VICVEPRATFAIELLAQRSGRVIAFVAARAAAARGGDSLNARPPRAVAKPRATSGGRFCEVSLRARTKGRAKSWTLRSVADAKDNSASLPGVEAPWSEIGAVARRLIDHQLRPALSAPNRSKGRRAIPARQSWAGRATQPLVLPRLSANWASCTSAGRVQKRRGRVKGGAGLAALEPSGHRDRAESLSENRLAVLGATSVGVLSRERGSPLREFNPCACSHQNGLSPLHAEACGG
jgi:hypothetical protein